MRITVVGAGISGLTTALTLEERGHEVRIIAAHPGADTPSAVAGAVWVPYRAGPPARVAAWAARTRAWLEGLAEEPATGVDVLTGYAGRAAADDPRRLRRTACPAARRHPRG